MAVNYHHLGTCIASRATLTTVEIFNTPVINRIDRCLRTETCQTLIASGQGPESHSAGHTIQIGWYVLLATVTVLARVASQPQVLGTEQWVHKLSTLLALLESR
jgi:hypothetical protein